MRLNKTTNDAVKILVDCARVDGKLLKVADIAARIGLSQQNTFKIVHLLSRAGFVSAVRGRHGGVRLAHAADEIRIGQVVRAIEANSTAANAVHQPGASAGEFGGLVDDAFEAFIQVLDRQTVADMAAAQAAQARHSDREEADASAGEAGEDAGRVPAQPKSPAAASTGIQRRSRPTA